MSMSKSDRIKEMGLKLKIIRKREGLRQIDMAQLMEVSLSSYRRYENGTLTLNSENLKFLVTKFKVDANWFLGAPPDIGQRAFNDKMDAVISQLQNLKITP